MSATWQQAASQALTGCYPVHAAWDRGRGRGSLRHLRAVRAAVEAVRP